jgi:multidrug efflux system outer membrane protein
LFDTSSGADARAWSVAPTLSWPAFDLGSVRAKLRESKAQSDAAAANYEKTVLTALEDTENSFLAYTTHQAELKSLAEQATASRRAADLAEIRYRDGAADFLVLLDAQRTQLDAEDAVAQAESEVNVSVVAIYKALGGVGQRLDDGSGDAPGKLVAQAR